MRAAIKRVLAPGRRERVIAVAFVGADALRFLPSPRNIEIYCWPKAGGTNPHAIEQLLEAGATVKFVDHLHMKLYASVDGGAVIGSANLTANALGEGGLIECGMLLEKGVVRAHSLLKTLTVVRDFDARLRRLHEEHVRFYQRNPFGNAPKKIGAAAKAQARASFLTWYKTGASRQPWRWGWYSEDVKPPKDATSQLEVESGSAKYRRFLGVERRTSLSPSEFTLNLQVQRRRDGSLQFGQPSWWIPKICVKSTSKSWSDCPYLWFAQQLPSPPLKPPFNERDPHFTKALRQTIKELGGVDVIDKEPSVPSLAFLRQLASHYETFA